jgi:ribonuclease D
MTVEFIDQHADLVDFCSRIKGCEWMTVDTEFLREKTYHPQLCLIQVATPDYIACIDPLKLTDLNPILDLLYNPDITVVFHAARQDLELLFLIREALPAPIFDTQIAATVLGYGEQIGYGNLVSKCLGVELDKAHSRTDWTKRPLDPAQIEYAADDVRYLRDVYLLLNKELADKNRRHWLDEDFDLLTNKETYIPQPEAIWRKTKGAGRLKGLQLAILQKLASWREQRAIKSNRPRRWILKDDILLDLAKLVPDSIDKLSMVRGLEEKLINRFGQTWIDLIEQAKVLPKDQWPVIKKPQPLTNQQDAVVDAVLALLRKLCDEHDIATSIVATRKEIEKLVSGERDLAILQGWRNDIIGHKLLAFINGEISITANSDQLNTQQD